MAKNCEDRVTDLRDRSQRLLTLLFASSAFIITPFIILPTEQASRYTGAFFVFVGFLVFFLGGVSHRSLEGMSEEAKLYFRRATFLYHNAYRRLRRLYPDIEFEPVLVEDENYNAEEEPYDQEEFTKTFRTSYTFGKRELYRFFPKLVMILGVAYLVLGAFIASEPIWRTQNSESILPEKAEIAATVSEESVDEECTCKPLRVIARLFAR